jgi:hypothetical protein
MTKTTTSTRSTPIQTEADSDYDRVMAALRAALGDSDLIAQLDEAVGARLVAAEDEVMGLSLESQVAGLRRDLEELRQQLATEVRTRRVVVVGPDGFERITASADINVGMVRVDSRRDGMHVALVADEDDPQASAELYLSAGGNGVGAFGVLEDGVITGDEEHGFSVDPDTIEYVTSISIDPDHHDPRFHRVTLDREGLHYGG